MRLTMLRTVVILGFIFLYLESLASCCKGQSTPVTDAYKHPSGGYVVVHGAKLWYESEGSGEPILLIPGGPGDAHDYFHPFFSVLAKKYRIIYFDPFGRGNSDLPKSSSEYTFDRDVEDVEGVRCALGLGKIILFGHSYGGMVAQAYALKYPASLKKLIFLGAPISGEQWQQLTDIENEEYNNLFPDEWDKVQKLRAEGFRGSDRELQRVFYSVPMGRFVFYYNPDNGKKLTVVGKNDPNVDVYYALAGDDPEFFLRGDLAKFDYRNRLKTIQAPTLILAGRFDRSLPPRFALEYKRYMPQATFVLLEKSGHLPFVEQPDPFFSAITTFLDAAPTAAKPSTHP